jgi:V/A-type H+/Na+-transporting ATPase subunit E
MDNKLLALTEKLYNEGVEKGKEQAEKIILEAKSEAEKIIGSAHNEAKEIIVAAKDQSSEMMKNTRSELQMASKQAINALMQEVISMINGSIVSVEVKKSIDDPEFMKNLILNLVSGWSENQNMKVVVPENQQAEIMAFMTQKAKNLLESGLTIESANKIKAGFQIGPTDGSYKVSFTETDFINFFKEFLRPKVAELLFGQK